ncbi:HK97 gp10 family phage protein [Ralstonia holmesii]|uniref:HK97 gp10 family phage protein n=1 Tax=Ralstonia holmesii TaxID=3058602 RepID=UPI0028F51AC3|nr:HK97 gp10 family phage protein [Ralstonia sp. LMG 32967]CAJ0705821.1 hypothetical protein R11007_04698 [Ralstonia sp. LMG 32967]
MKEFGDLASFAAHLVLAEVTAHKALEKGLDKAAAHIEHAAKDKIGEYQAANGMHEAWPELAESTKEDRVRKGFTENDPLLRTGDLRDSISHETHGLEAAIGSTSDIAVYQELGTDKIPPRPFLGAAAYESIDEVKKLVGGAVITGIVGGNSLDYKV